MPRRLSRRARAGLWLLAVLPWTAGSVQAQPELTHVGLACVEPGRFAVVLSVIDPSEVIRSARVYFRSSLFIDFYFVEMKRDGTKFVAILPQPAAETPRVVYYVEAVDSEYRMLRSPDFDPLVVDPCDDDERAGYLPKDPAILVGATNGAGPALPPGFSPSGIVGTLAAGGAGGGIGAGVLGAAAGAAGAAGAVVVTKRSGDAGTTTSSVGPVSGSTTTTATGGGASSTTTTTVPASSTTSTTSTSSSTSTSTTTTTVKPLNPHCFTVEVRGPCKIRVDASCVNLPVDRYSWVLDENDVWKRHDFPGSPDAFAYNWMASDCGADAVLAFRLTVNRGAESVSALKNVLVPGDDPPPSLRSEVRFVRLHTHLAVPPGDGSIRGRVVLDQTLSRPVDGSRPTVIEGRTRAGRREVLALLDRPAAEPGTWRFDLRGTEGLVAGSLRVLEGELLSAEPEALVFRVERHRSERLRFSFRVD